MQHTVLYCRSEAAQVLVQCKYCAHCEYCHNRGPRIQYGRGQSEAVARYSTIRLSYKKGSVHDTPKREPTAVTNASRRCHAACPHQGGVGLATRVQHSMYAEWHEMGCRQDTCTRTTASHATLLVPPRGFRPGRSDHAPPVPVPRPHKDVRVRCQMTDHLI